MMNKQHYKHDGNCYRAPEEIYGLHHSAVKQNDMPSGQGEPSLHKVHFQTVRSLRTEKHAF